jgi:hypothetical protein
MQHDINATRTSDNTPKTHTPRSVQHGKAHSDSEESALLAISPRYRVCSLWCACMDTELIVLLSHVAERDRFACARLVQAVLLQQGLGPADADRLRALVHWTACRCENESALQAIVPERMGTPCIRTNYFSRMLPCMFMEP